MSGDSALSDEHVGTSDMGGLVPRVRLITTDGDDRTVEVVSGQSVVEAAKDAGVILPSLCGKGTCGTCVARVLSGEYTMRPFEDDALGASAGADAVLLCCTEPVTDMEVGLPFDSTKLIDDAPAERTASVVGLDSLTDEIRKVTLHLDADDLMGSAAEFDAGQFMQLAEPASGVLRAYSMSNVSNWDGALEFLIHIREGGLFSMWLRDHAAVGDSLQVVGPQGAFALEENGMRPRWFVGGGCGLAPLLSMLRRMAEWGDPQPVRLILGVNAPDNVFALDEIRDVTEMLPDMTVTLAVWDAASELPPTPHDRIEYVHGSSVDVLDSGLDTIQEPEELPDIYVCGPPGMVTALEKAVTERGIDANRIHSERISQN